MGLCSCEGMGLFALLLALYVTRFAPIEWLEPGIPAVCTTPPNGTKGHTLAHGTAAAGTAKGGGGISARDVAQITRSVEDLRGYLDKVLEHLPAKASEDSSKATPSKRIEKRSETPKPKDKDKDKDKDKAKDKDKEKTPKSPTQRAVGPRSEAPSAAAAPPTTPRHDVPYEVVLDVSTPAHADHPVFAQLARIADEVAQGSSDDLERSADSVQMQRHTELAAQWWVRTVCEIGFNAGRSAANWLLANPNATLHAYDLCRHAYVEDCRDLLDDTFPHRLHLTCGDSGQTVPLERRPAVVGGCDLLRIDGAHQGLAPALDMLYGVRLAAEGRHRVVADNVYCEAPRCRVPTLAWKALEAAGYVRTLRVVRYRDAHTNEPRGWVEAEYAKKYDPNVAWRSMEHVMAALLTAKQ